MINVNGANSDRRLGQYFADVVTMRDEILTHARDWERREGEPSPLALE